jgi:hypothetical protein
MYFLIAALPTDNRFALHSVAVCLLALHGTLMNVAAIDDYVIQVQIDLENFHVGVYFRSRFNRTCQVT